MRGVRKQLALIAVCSLVVTTVLPGTVSASVSGTDENAPQVTDVRILKERNYLEIRWDQEVQNSVDPANYVLKNGDQEFQLLTGNWNTMYFEGYALSSIGFEGTVDDSLPLTLEIVEDNSIRDEDGNGAESGIYTVDYENYYTQFYTSETGILVKASDDVQAESLRAAADQIDHMLGKAENGIADRMAEYGASLALYGPDENAYFVPEHRNAWDPDMYEVEGYGGNEYNGGVSSIAEKNVIRVLEGPAEDQTGYRNENILVHEFGHSVKSLGMDLLADQSLHDEFMALYNSRKQMGMWPNTYAISNADEFFATMCTIWFSVMQESPDWTDGVRGPVNTRDDLLKYDPETYAFFDKIFPEEFLDEPWDPSTIPDEYDAVFEPSVIEEGNHNYETDTFKILYDSSDGTEYHLEQYNGVVLWWNYGDEEINSWKLTRTEDGFHITTLDESLALAPVDGGSAVALTDADISDPEQLWNFIPLDGVTGRLIHVSTGQALGLASGAADGTALQLVDEADAPGWRIRNLTRDTALVPKENHDFEGTYFRVISAADGASVWENWDGGVIWNTVDSDRNSWKITPVGGGYFRIISLENPDMVLAPRDSGTAAGTRVMLAAGDGSDDTQLWYLENVNGYQRFVNKVSGLAIAIENNDMTSGTCLVLAEISDASIYQQWEVVNKTTSAALEQPDIPNYVEDPDNPGEPEDPSEPPEPAEDLPYGDVYESDWYYEAVDYVFRKGLMTGLSETAFGPGQPLARAQFAVILHRMNGEPPAAYSDIFADVPAGQWYTDAVLWANQEGIVTGYGGTGMFGTSDHINREQMAVMMFRYAVSRGLDTGERADFSGYLDASYVSDFAEEAMQWAVGSGILTGKYDETLLDPQGSASRAECAVIMMRFLEKYEIGSLS